jgi:hypothetical protein
VTDNLDQLRAQIRDPDDANYNLPQSRPTWAGLTDDEVLQLFRKVATANKWNVDARFAHEFSGRLRRPERVDRCRDGGGTSSRAPDLGARPVVGRDRRVYGRVARPRLTHPWRERLAGSFVPGARSRLASPVDFAFTQQMSPELAPPGWRPVFLDYLHLGFTNATAFSPTDVMPLTHRAKYTMLVRSTVALALFGLIVARAVNAFT